MKSKSNWKIGLAVLTLAGGMSIACDIDQTEEGEMPEVEVTGGNLPEYDVDAAEVDVDMEEKTVKVPDVDVRMPEEDDDNDPPNVN